MEKGLKSVLIFGVLSDSKYKSPNGDEAFSPTGPTQKAVKSIKSAFPNLLIVTDVCLCGFTESGHCGVLKDDGKTQQF